MEVASIRNINFLVATVKIKYKGKHEINYSILFSPIQKCYQFDHVINIKNINGILFCILFPYQVSEILGGFYTHSPAHSEPSGAHQPPVPTSYYTAAVCTVSETRRVPCTRYPWHTKLKMAACSGCLEGVFTHRLCQGQFPGPPSYSFPLGVKGRTESHP